MLKLRISKRVNYSGLLGWAQSNPTSPFMREAEETESEREKVTMEAKMRKDRRCYLSGFEVEDGGINKGM